MKYYLTTAIPYTNAAPHIGTAMDYLYADILLRYQLLRGNDVKLSVGTDEHGTKVEQKAADNKQTPQQFVDSLQPEFQKMRQALDLCAGAPIDNLAQPLAEQNFNEQNIINVRTTDPDHVRRVQAIWRKLDEAGVIYKSTYEGWYCSGCEAFVTETEARENNFICPDHQKPYEKLSEDNYYLAVSKFTDQIRDFVKTAVVPDFRANNLLGLLKDGAKDVSISRPVDKLQWGVPVPDDESQVMYVWIDALSNYLTALGYPDADWQSEFWAPKVQIVGKDIIRFHAIIWPAMLLALGLPLPEKLLVHGFINVDGQKMSKSIGNVVSPIEIINEYGLDAFRYYFTSHVTTFNDGDFTWKKFENAYNGELANDLGNLIARVAAMIRKYFDGSLTFVDETGELKDQAETLLGNYRVAMDGLDLTAGITAVMAFIHEMNQYIEQSAPWKVAKIEDEAERNERLVEIFSTLVNGLLLTAKYLSPFLPATADFIHQTFAGDEVPAKAEILYPKKYLHTEEVRH
ncbi:MAG: methionine--tRNA ligase [Candidatus Saccharibacteria bacterium]|nr:methionine--tRNA ligase [Candidatus Saccharibacteria bacterium]